MTRGHGIGFFLAYRGSALLFLLRPSVRLSFSTIFLLYDLPSVHSFPPVLSVQTFCRAPPLPVEFNFFTKKDPDTCRGLCPLRDYLVTLIDALFSAYGAVIVTRL